MTVYSEREQTLISQVGKALANYYGRDVTPRDTEVAAVILRARSGPLAYDRRGFGTPKAKPKVDVGGLIG